ncbi:MULTISPECIES: MFS transporter [Aliiglaciecola]|uniref:MFS transporter n=1 Tax=Aliiglaciecola TaxID=1406885 RepID=UPI001C08D3A9|nr:MULTISPECIES: MFS transporter [Aliiglaciecola]MBU2880140.1 MFS transporter [Aliiglaciecola lipolytica]MDO6710864.1 MFS transporter [Aliiglaciecola sp. 2_MG-2023]MDO6752345.1 MFS transporter [Aliiglaciecola sp. 1_MG-2023]
MKEGQSIQTFEHILDDGKLSLTQILVVFISFLLMILDGFDITSMSFVAQRVSEQLNINPTNLGLVFSVTLAGMMLGAMIIAPYADKIGRRKMLIASVIAIGISMFLTGLVSAFWQLVVLRTITGLGVGAMLANVTALTSEYTPTKYRSFSVAIISAGFPLGATIGGIIVVPILPTYGWEIVFFSLGLVTLVMAVVVYCLVPESLQFLKTQGTDSALNKVNLLLTKMNRSTISEFVVDNNYAINKASVLSLLSPTFRTKTIQLWLTFLCVFISLYFLLSWLPKLVINEGLSESDSVFSAVALNGGGVIGSLLLGWFAANFGLTKLITIFLSISGLAMLSFGFLFEFMNLFILLFIIGFLLLGAYVGLYSTSAKMYPTEVRATGIGWALGLGRFGAVIGPYVGGLLITYGFSMELNFAVFAIPLLIAAAIVFQLKVR